MVNTHRKFPAGAKHNAYYAADGTDLRDATKEEVEKYRLAAMHKRKKPDVDPTWRKGGSSASTSRGSKEQTRRHDDTLRKDDSSRDREVDRGTQGREAEVKSSRPSSREAWRERGAGSRERCNSDGRKDTRREKDASSTERRQSDVKTDKQKEKDKSSKGRGGSDVKKDGKDKDDRMLRTKGKETE